MCLRRTINRNVRARKVAEEIARIVVDEFRLRGERDFLDGTSPEQFIAPAHTAGDALRSQLKRGAATWASFLAVDYYHVLATSNEQELRRALVGMSATLNEWILSLDRRAEDRRWPK